MLNFKGMRLPAEVILVCIRWYAAYSLSIRNLEELMQERGVLVDHSTVSDLFSAGAGKSISQIQVSGKWKLADG